MTRSPAPDKPALRRQLSATLKALPAAHQQALSNNLCQQLKNDPTFLAAHSVLFFAPVPGEPDIRLLAQPAVDQSKRVCFPRTDWPARTMAPVPVANWAADLTLSPQRILEPRPDLPAINPSILDLVLVPGLAFDLTGNRLGRGAGFYDRFLATLSPHTKTLGVCFDEQVLPTLPTDPHDIRVQGLVTPTRLLWF